MLLGILLLFPWSDRAGGECVIAPNEPAFAWHLVEDAEPLPDGLILVVYRPVEGGSAVHVTLHRVVYVLPGKPNPIPEVEASRHAMLIIDGPVGTQTYIADRDPLYYGSDPDSDGMPRRVWIDAEEDGLNGNERLVGR
jgi:hypothetical protein